MAQSKFILAWPDEAGGPESVPGNRPRGLGQWLVSTASRSTYLIDVNRRTATRYPAEVGRAGWVAPQLRRDAEELPMLAVRCAPGTPMVLVLDLRGDGVPTVRVTTPVSRVEPA